jgi:predicted Zn-dependent peptidase
MKDEDLIAAKLLAILLGGTMSSRLFLSVREKKGLAYMIHSGYEAYEDIGYFWIQAGLDQTRLPLALRTIFAELKSLKTHGILASELAFVKEHLQGKLALQLEDSADQAQWFGRQELFLQKTLSVKEWLAICQKVKKKDIESMAHVLFKKEHACMAAIGPFKEPEAFETFLPKVWF